MDTLGYILVFTFLSSIVSLLGGVILLAKEKLAHKISHYLASFAAGALLATAFLDLLPEAFHQVKESEINVFMLTLLGILIFFLLERFIHWFHHHHEHQGQEDQSTVALITIGDSVHNFIDGVVLAATFMVSIPLGMVTAIAIAAHEIPQEIGDFGIMLHKGVSRKKILFLNFLSAFSALVGALLTYFIGDSIESLLPIFLSLAAGFFIYIAASDLIPEIHNEERKLVALIETLLLLLGVITIFVFMTFLEGH